MNNQKTRHSQVIQIEKLDGGYISDILGKRKIYGNSLILENDINIKNVVNDLEEGDYILNINIVPKNEFVDNIIKEGEAFYNKSTPEEADETKKVNEPGWAQAVKDGIIEKADKFNPINYNPDLGGTISVNLANCYTIDELTKFDWKGADAKIPLSYSEKSQITGIKDSNLHNLWPKISGGKYQWTVLDTRIKMTILAKYYQQKLEKKAKIESLPPRNDKRLMEVVTEIELLCKSSMVKSNVLLKKVEQFKKLLIQD